MLATTPGAVLASAEARLGAAMPNTVTPAATAAAASSGNGGNDWRVDAHAFGAGAGRASAGLFEVTAIVGQPDAGALVPATSARFAVVSGFWSVAATADPRPDLLLADSFEQ